MLLLQYLDPDGEECLEEGQEEWLSEGVLTDDDYVQNVSVLLLLYLFCNVSLCALLYIEFVCLLLH